MPPTLTTKSSVLPEKPNLPEFKIVTKALAGGTNEAGRRRFNAVASSTITDRQGDEISLKGLQQMAQKFREGVTIFTDHKNEVFNAFGTTDSAEIVEGGIDPKSGARIWDLKIAGNVNEPNPNAVQLHESITGGYVKLGCSIDAFVTDHKPKQAGRYDIDGLDVFAASIVGVPANQRSWASKAVRAIKSFYGEPEEDDVNEGFEVQPGDVAELVVNADGSSTAAVIARAGTPEAEAFSATYGDADNPVELDTAAEIVELDAELEASKSVEPIVLGTPEEEAAFADALEKSDLSSGQRDNLDADQFACPEKRKYPINDAAHVRAALSRIADPSNDQCGRDKIMAAARRMGIGEHGKSLDESEAVQKASDMDADDKKCPTCGKGHGDGGDCPNSYHSAAKSVDGEGGQESSQETPETAPIVSAEAEPLDEKAAGLATEDVHALIGHVERLVKEIGGLREENQRLRDENMTLKQANKAVYGEVELAKTVIEKVMQTPLRSQTAGYVKNFTEVHKLFDPEIAAYLAKRGE